MKVTVTNIPTRLDNTLYVVFVQTFINIQIIRKFKMIYIIVLCLLCPFYKNILVIFDNAAVALRS
jgi:hypothetical protein